MAKYTQAQFEGRWGDFVSETCSIHFNTTASNLFNTNFNINLTGAGGTTTLAYYPDYDDNEDIPAVFYLNGDKNYPISITYRQMNEGDPFGRMLLWNAINAYFSALVHHWTGIKAAITEVSKWTTVTDLGTGFGPDGEDSRGFMEAVSDAYHKHDIHS